jgi:hypothetical protein
MLSCRRSISRSRSPGSRRHRDDRKHSDRDLKASNGTAAAAAAADKSSSRKRSRSRSRDRPPLPPSSSSSSSIPPPPLPPSGYVLPDMLKPAGTTDADKLKARLEIVKRVTGKKGDGGGGEHIFRSSKCLSVDEV